jgi:hypothetical protein
MAKYISGTSGNLTSIGSVGGAASKKIQSKVVQARSAIANRIKKTKLGRAVGQVTGKIQKGVNYIADTPSRLVDKARLSSLRKGATSSKGYSVLQVMAQNATGINRNQLNKDANKDYKGSIANILRTLDPKMSKRAANNQAGKLSKKKYSEVRDAMARIAFGKDIDKLNASESNALNKLVVGNKGGKSLIKRDKDSNDLRRFQEAYIDSYEKLSAKKIGLIGKQISNKVTKSNLRKEKMKKSFENQKQQKVEERKKLEDSNYRELSDKEQKLESKKALEREVFRASLESQKQLVGKNVTSPEYLAQLEQEAKQKQMSDIQRDSNLGSKKGFMDMSGEKSSIGEFMHLEKKEIEHNVYEALTKGDDPALKGQNFMKNKATNEDYKHQIDRMVDIEAKLQKTDPYISKEESYQKELDKSYEVIKSNLDEIGELYQGGEFDEKQLTEVIESHYNRGSELSQSEINAKLNEFKGAINSYNNTQNVLQKIDQRKVDISKAISSHIGSVNDHQAGHNYTKYSSPSRQSEPVVRKFRSITDYKKK